jgi:tyrosinase
LQINFDFSDPAFYRLHAYVDDMFQQHKIRLPRYTATQLTYPGVTVAKVTVESEGAAANTFQTFWEQSDVDFSRGLDFVTAKGSVFAR